MDIESEVRCEVVLKVGKTIDKIQLSKSSRFEFYI